MKKVVVILIAIAVAGAIFAAIAVKTDLFKSAEAEKPAVEQKIEANELKKNLKLQNIKIRKFNIDKKNVEKYKKEHGRDPNFKKREKCGE
ncbi:hypothetical protein J5681_01320 [bacterium]|nr:hypothetical protein [bacterium]